MKFWKITAALLALCAPVFATDVGVEGGVAFVNGSLSISGTSIPTNSKTYFNGGIFGDFAICDHMSFRPEALYQTSSPDYLAVPLMVTYGMTFGAFRPFVFLGPDVSIRVSSGATAGTLKTLNLAVDGGVGGDYWVTPTIAIGANWRYSLGLMNIADDPTGAASAKTRDMYLLGAVTFKL